MKRQKLRIVKLGGSLLGQSQWVSAFATWIETQSSLRNIIVIGGGLSADAVRAFDRVHQLDPHISHDLAVEALGLSLQLAASILPHARVVESVSECATEKGLAGIELLDVRPFLRGKESKQPGTCLPHDWSATSDSIAARIASVYQADELVLLKSRLPIDCANWEEVALSGLVDEYFPRAVQQVKRAYCVDLTDPKRTSWKPTIELNV